jgi:hypothetical protein
MEVLGDLERGASLVDEKADHRDDRFGFGVVDDKAAVRVLGSRVMV